MYVQCFDIYIILKYQHLFPIVCSASSSLGHPDLYNLAGKVRPRMEYSELRILETHIALRPAWNLELRVLPTCIKDN